MRKPFVVLLGVAVFGLVILGFLIVNRLKGDSASFPSEPVVSTHPPGSESFKPLTQNTQPVSMDTEKQATAELQKEEKKPEISVPSYELLNLDYEIAKLERQKKIAELKRDIKELESATKRGGVSGSMSSPPPSPPPPPPPLPQQFPMSQPFMPTQSPSFGGPSEGVSPSREITVRSVVCSDECVAVISVGGQEMPVRKGSTIAGVRVVDIRDGEVVFDGAGGLLRKRVSLNIDKREQARPPSQTQPVRLQPSQPIPVPMQEVR